MCRRSGVALRLQRRSCQEAQSYREVPIHRSSQSLESCWWVPPVPLWATPTTSSKSASVAATTLSLRPCRSPSPCSRTPSTARSRVEAESERMFRSSEITLSGAGEKRIHTLEFKNLPAGDYTLSAQVYSSSEMRAVATQQLTVSGGGTLTARQPAVDGIQACWSTAYEPARRDAARLAAADCAVLMGGGRSPGVSVSSPIVICRSRRSRPPPALRSSRPAGEPARPRNPTRRYPPDTARARAACPGRPCCRASGRRARRAGG